MFSLSSEGLPGLDQSRLNEARRIGRAILSRTGRHVCFNAQTGGLFIYLKGDDLDSGVHELPFATPNIGGFAIRERNQHEIDDVCRWLQRGNMPRELKDRLAAEEKEQKEKAREQERGVFCDGMTKEADTELRRLKNRHGMGKHFTPSVVVDGLKGD